MARLASLLLAIWFLVGCSGLRIQQAESLAPTLAEVGRDDCRAWVTKIDKLVDLAGVRDYQAATIPGFPYLRINRFLASFRDQLSNDAVYTQWLDRLQTLDLEARRYELANLPSTVRAGWGENDARIFSMYKDCSEVLTEVVLDDPVLREQLLDNSDVPDAYHTSWRFFGLYPLTSLVVANRIAAYHEDTLETFRVSVSQLPVSGRLIRYGPERHQFLPPTQISEILHQASDNALQIPLPSRDAQEKLFASFAPVWEIDTVDNNDRVGQPYWGDSSRPGIDIRRPVVYQHISHVRFQEKSLLQLNYVIWFPARPLTGFWDIYGGRIDGIIWRVTIDEDGYPLLFDSVHNCGCYHKLYPTAKLKLQTAIKHREPPLVPQAIPFMKDGERMVIRIASRTHFIQRIYNERAPVPDAHYSSADYDMLRSLSYIQEQQRGMFGKGGIVPGSQRSERWILWPMGILSPGAMRQWGQHAIAFVGRRHFDDARLIEQFFFRKN